LPVGANKIHAPWLGTGGEFNLVKGVVIAICVSPTQDRRELVINILVDPFTFGVARAIDKITRERGDFTKKPKDQRLMAIIFALKDLGFVFSDDDGSTTSICFSAEAKELRGELSDERLGELAKHQICFKMTKLDMSRSIELSGKYLAVIDSVEVTASLPGRDDVTFHGQSPPKKRRRRPSSSGPRLKSSASI
jgi:hypothetical protein